MPSGAGAMPSARRPAGRVRVVNRLREWTMSLPWPRPPLSLNDRMHWQVRHRLTVQVRQAAAVLARHHRVP